MLIGYVHVYHDFASGVRDDRPGLDSCVRALRTGDVLVVWKLDRLGRALVHESKLARHGPNHRCFIDRRRRKLGGPYRSSHSAYCTRAALRPFSHRVSWLEDHRR